MNKLCHENTTSSEEIRSLWYDFRQIRHEKENRTEIVSMWRNFNEKINKIEVAPT